jgi:hypothetical protein
MEGQLTPATGTKHCSKFSSPHLNFNLILSVRAYTIQSFLSSALANYPAIDEETNEKKEDTINRYAALLKKDQLSGELNHDLLTTEALRALGLPSGHAASIWKAATYFGGNKGS